MKTPATQYELDNMPPASEDSVSTIKATHDAIAALRTTGSVSAAVKILEESVTYWRNLKNSRLRYKQYGLWGRGKAVDITTPELAIAETALRLIESGRLTMFDVRGTG